MARIRTLKPDFFRSRSLAKCTRDARLTFQGLWVEADDAGRGLADARILKGSIWPLDDDITATDVEAHLDELDGGHIRLYEVDGDRYYLILNWEKHQAAAYRKADPKYPPPPVAHVDVHGAHGGVLEGNGREGKGRDDDENLPGPKPSSSFSPEQRCAHQLARRLLARRPAPPEDDTAWVAGTRKGLLTERGDEIRARLTQATPDDVAREMAAAKPPPPPPVEDHPHDCPVCDGQGWVYPEDTDELKPFLHRCTWTPAEVVELRRSS